MRALRLFIAILLSFILSLPLANAETITEALGEKNHILAVNTEKGDAYVNDYSRTYNPSIERWGTHTGRTSNGDAIIQLDNWTIADVLGPNYRLLAYTADRGNCYVNANNETYTPGSNQYGRVTGHTANGVPVISVIGTIYAETHTVITRTTTYYSGVPAANPTPTPEPSGIYVYIMPETGEKYHVKPHGRYNSVYRIPLEQAVADGYTPCMQQTCYGD